MDEIARYCRGRTLLGRARRFETAVMRDALFSPALLAGSNIGLALERAALAIARLDARVSAGFVRVPWTLRASWMGYAYALQLAGTENDEIDVFSWATGVTIPGRPGRSTVIDPFARFPAWQARLGGRGRHWAEDLPFTLERGSEPSTAARLARAFDLLSRWLNVEPGLAAWLALPIHLTGSA